MAAHLIVLLLFSVFKGVHSITTVSKVSVKAGKSISIPCLYESQYIDHVKYLCEGHIWGSCRYVIKTNKPDPSGKYLISDDKKQNIFTVTINKLTVKNTDYWCVVEIDNGPDHGQYFQLLVINGTPSLYVDHQRITGYIGESITIRCHHSNSGEMKWCKLGRNCVTGSSGSTDGTTVSALMKEQNVFTVTISGLKSEDSGWYLCAEGAIQIPVYLNVMEKPITSTTTAATTPTTATTGSNTTHTVAGSGTITTVEENREHRASFDPKILIIPLSVLTLIVIVMLFIWFIMRHKQNKAESSATAMSGDEVTYSEVRPKKKRSPKSSSAESNVEIIYSSVVKKQFTERGDRKATEVTYSTLAEMF